MMRQYNKMLLPPCQVQLVVLEGVIKAQATDEAIQEVVAQV